MLPRPSLSPKAIRGMANRADPHRLPGLRSHLAGGLRDVQFSRPSARMTAPLSPSMQMERSSSCFGQKASL